MSRRFESSEIIKMVDFMVGDVRPAADSAIDREVKENLKTMIDVVNWCLTEMYESASNRKSPYGSAMDIGELAYSALLEWEEWLRGVEEELA